MSIQKIVDAIGLDSIPLLFGKKTIIVPTRQEMNDIRQKIVDLNQEEIEEGITYSKEIYTSENSRCAIIEGKAQSLIGIIGIATGFVLGATNLLPENADSTWLKYPIIIDYILIALSLITTLLLAFKVIKVGDYFFSIPHINEVYKLSEIELNEFNKGKLVSYIFGYKNNFDITNIKGTYLIGAQKWFRNAILLFLILAIFYVFCLLEPKIPTNFYNISPTPTITSIPSSTSSSPILSTSPTLFWKTETPFQKKGNDISPKLPTKDLRIPQSKFSITTIPDS